MEPVVLEVAEKDGRKVVVTYDAQSLFESGKAAYKTGKFAQCIEDYTQLLARFPASRYSTVAVYNRGLCLEEDRQFGLAVRDFRTYTGLVKTDSDLLDGRFRWGFNLVESGNYPLAVRLYDQLLNHPTIGEFDRAEAHLRRGIARMALRQYAEAEKDFRSTLKWVEQKTQGQIQGNDLAAESHYRRGELFGILSSNVKLKLPLKSMKSDLDSKIRFFRRAQSGFVDALNVRSPYWATAAGLKLGELYERFYDDVISAEVPKGFDLSTRQYYLLELKAQLQPVLTHSISIYERNIAMGLRLGTDNEWLKETEQRLNKLRALIEENKKAADEMGPLDSKKKPKGKRPKKRSRIKKPESA